MCALWLEQYTKDCEQDEEALVCRVATQHDQNEAMQLSQSAGWSTLLAILESYGERPRKRPWPIDVEEAASPAAGSPSDQLAKRFKQAAKIQP